MRVPRSWLLSCLSCPGARGRHALPTLSALDAFADRPGAGNPLGVGLDAAGLDATAMQTIAAFPG